MAFNPAFQLRRTRTNNSLQNDTSSLVEKANSILSESQSSWVLFSPSLETASAVNVGSDILSLTVDSQQEEDEQDDDDDDEEFEEDGDDTRPLPLSSEFEDDDSLIDNFRPSQEGTSSAAAAAAAAAAVDPASVGSRLEHMILNYTGTDSSLRKRINKWKSTQDVVPPANVNEDNIASWDLDENIITELLHQSPTQSQMVVHHHHHHHASAASSALLSASASSRGAKYYGNDIFKSYSRKDILRFKKIANNLKGSLNRKDGDDDQTSSLTYLIMKLFERQQQQQQQQQHSAHRTPYPIVPGSTAATSSANNFQKKRYSTILKEFTNLNDNRNFLSTVIENQIKNSTYSHNGNDYFYDDSKSQPDRYSSTASSSLVMCGGVGFGTGSSWKDI